MAYLDGAASVVGKARTGAYGFRDFIKWLCGSAPTDAEVAQGWPHIYQWNNGSIDLGGMTADLDWAYPGVIDALRNSLNPAPAHQ